MDYKELAEVIWTTSHNDEGTVSATGANIIAKELLTKFDITRKDEPDDEGTTAEDDTLGNCGCVDYHMSDCPLRTAAYDSMNEPDPDDFYDRDYE